MTDQDKRYRIREERGERTATLLNSLSLDQLRSVLASIAVGAKARCRTKEEAIDALLALELGNVRRAAYRIEASTPSKHCFFIRMEAVPDDRLVRQLLSGEVLDSNGQMHPVNKEQFGEHICLTFEFALTIEEWVTSLDRNSKHRRERRIRQPVVVRFSRSSPIVIVTYPGFSRGYLGNESVNTEQLVRIVYNHLQTHYKIRIANFPIVKHVGDLTKAHSSAVVIISQCSSSAFGRLDVEADNRNRSIIDVLEQTVCKPFHDKIPRSELRSALAEATKTGPVESMVVHWTAENLICRLLFWDIGPEFLFVWPQQERSFGAIDKIADLLLSVARDVESPTRSQIWERVLAMKEEELLFPAELIQQTNISAEDLQAIVADALRGGLLRPEYQLRVRTHVESNPFSGWTTDLASLAKPFVGPNEEVIDGRDPRNILVAFRRVYRHGDAT